MIEFLDKHRSAYKNLYLETSVARSSMLPEICDNGGFENDFLHYDGFITTYSTGSDDCIPLDVNGNPSAFAPTTLPLNRRFQIVNAGIDPLIGVDMVKFGNKALKINERYGTGSTCNGDFGVDKITKEFIVTEDNRDFTVWYAVALENPTGHLNQQPFLNITCDRAPETDLCFDADIIFCDSLYTDPNCTFDKVDVLEWSCHRIKIPKEFVDSTALLEITIGDCGRGGHFGYAYIDGICEECTGSALGSINLEQNFQSDCDGIQICGSFTLPTTCDLGWNIQEIKIDHPQIGVHTTTANLADSSFCFNIDYEFFQLTGDCIDVFAEITFTNGGFDLPTQLSNNIEICPSDIDYYQEIMVVSDCFDNSTKSLISDDYYFVTLDLINTGGTSWSLTRSLDNPYPDESGVHTLDNGQGDTSIDLGPFFIIEGSWELEIMYGDSCVDSYSINPPEYCSGCEDLRDFRVTDITCIPHLATNPNDDEWTFEIEILNPGANPNSLYDVSGTNVSIQGTYNSSVLVQGSLSPLLITNGCINLNVKDLSITPLCDMNFEICPPKPCNDNLCDLEVYIHEVDCTKGVNDYSLELEIIGSGDYLCYAVDGVVQGGLSYGFNIIGPFTADAEIEVYKCPLPQCTTSGCETATRCRKTIKFPELDCERPRFRQTQETIAWRNEASGINIFPNPNDGTFRVKSDVLIEKLQIYNIEGRKVIEKNNIANEAIFVESLDIGLYIVVLLLENGDRKTRKMIIH